jgi:diguanylate cyclase (GGDEF)-like protein/PAS domain S-box-containing protein
MADADPSEGCPPAGAGGGTGPGSTPWRRTWVRKSAAAVITEMDQSMPDVLGWARADVVGKTSLEFIHPDDQTMAVDNWMQMLGAPGPSLPVRFRHRHGDGSWRWVEMTNHNFLDDPSRAFVMAEMLVSDDPITETALGLGAEGPGSSDGERPLQLHEALRAREHLLHRLSEALPVGVLHVDASGRVLYTNQRLHTIVDRERATTVLDQLSTVVAEDMPSLQEAFETALHGGLDNDIEIRIAAADSHGGKGIRQCTLSIRTLTDDAGETLGAVACLLDVTESVRMRDELRLQATFDTLTTCYNRASTMEALGKMLEGAPDGSSPAVIFVDLDGFKNVNDHLGHAAGDQVLEIVARRLQRAVRDGDIVGRIGGDEFLVLCPGIGSPAEAVGAATRVTESLRRPFKLETAEIPCRASVGVTWTHDPDAAADTLIGQADAAMYEAKRGGLGRPVLYGHVD